MHPLHGHLLSATSSEGSQGVDCENWGMIEFMDTHPTGGVQNKTL